MTLAITKKPPKNIAVQNVTQRVLALDEQNQINVFQFDDTTPEVQRLGLDLSKQIPLPILSKANLVYSFSMQIGIAPGSSPANDERLIATIKANISPNITNSDAVIVELIEAWNYMSNHPLSKNSSTASNSSAAQTRFRAQDNYELAIYGYVTKYLSTLMKFDNINTWLFLQSNELLRSTLEGRFFSTNPYEQMDCLMDSFERCATDLPESKDIVSRIKAKLRRNEEWFAHLSGIVGQEMRDLLEEESLNKEELKTAVLKLLSDDNDYTDISSNKDITDYLPMTIRLLQSPHDPAFAKYLMTNSANPPSIANIRFAIQATIRKIAKQSDFELAFKRVTPPPPIIDKTTVASSSTAGLPYKPPAASPLDSESDLIDLLFDDSISISQIELLEIQRNAKSDVLKDVVAARLQVQQQAIPQPLPVLNGTQEDPSELVARLLDQPKSFTVAELDKLLTDNNPIINEIATEIHRSKKRKGDDTLHNEKPNKIPQTTAATPHQQKYTPLHNWEVDRYIERVLARDRAQKEERERKDKEKAKAKANRRSWCATQ